MLRPRSLLMAVLLTVSALTGVHAQTASVSIPAWIETSACEAAPKFEAALNGKPVPVTAQSGPTTDQFILVVLDLTGDLSLIEAAKPALIAAISKLPPNAWVGLLRDQDGLHVLADPSAQRQPVIDAIRSLSNSGEPGLLESVGSALTLADAIMRESPVRVSVLYLTDGSIYRYREDYTNPVINQSDPHDLSRRFPEALIQEKISKLVEDAGSLQAPLFVVHLNYQPDRLNRAYQNGLETLAAATGGKSAICRSAAEVPDAISGLLARISSAWRVTLAVPARIRTNVQIQLSAPCRDGGQRISWRTHFHPKEG
ncbi:MAG TPA: hypothetical protein VKM93_11920 [Terriglobia bacterium]|nr:hypothetical protein [Terriglobia bacterium]